MPKIYEYFGFVFFFYSNEHEPIHVHVVQGEYQSVFELILQDGQLIGLNRRDAKGFSRLPDKCIKVAEEFIRVYYSEIVKKWVDYFVLKKTIKCTEIKTRL